MFTGMDYLLSQFQINKKQEIYPKTYERIQKNNVTQYSQNLQLISQNI